MPRSNRNGETARTDDQTHPMPTRLIRWLRARFRRRRAALQVTLNGVSLLLLVLRTTLPVADVMANGLPMSLTLGVSIPRGLPLVAPPLHAVQNCPTTTYGCERRWHSSSGSYGNSATWSRCSRYAAGRWPGARRWPPVVRRSRRRRRSAAVTPARPPVAPLLKSTLQGQVAPYPLVKWTPPRLRLLRGLERVGKPPKHRLSLRPSLNSPLRTKLHPLL